MKIKCIYNIDFNIQFSFLLIKIVQLKTINEYNFWQADSVMIASNRYTKRFMKINIVMYYNPANHLVYT